MRGRPPKYFGNVAKHIAGLARRHGQLGAQEILNAPAGSELGAKRNLKLVPKALGISLPTIAKLASRAGVKFELGRRAA